MKRCTPGNATGRARAVALPHVAAPRPTLRPTCEARRGTAARGFLEDAINAVTVAVKESPLNKGKVALAKMQAGDYDQAAVKAKLEGLLTSKPVMVFSFSTCPFCVKAKALLDEVGASYEVLELNQMGKEGLQLRAELAEMTDRTSMPSVWIAGSFVGGCNDGPGVVPLHRDGKLVPLLQQAGAMR